MFEEKTNASIIIEKTIFTVLLVKKTHFVSEKS